VVAPRALLGPTPAHGVRLGTFGPGRRTPHRAANQLNGHAQLEAAPRAGRAVFPALKLPGPRGRLVAARPSALSLLRTNLVARDQAISRT